jgi:hypothetical protein
MADKMIPTKPPKIASRKAMLISCNATSSFFNLILENDGGGSKWFGHGA